MKIGKRIRQLRKKKGMTILELANMINSDVGNISRLERDIQGYSQATLEKLSKALGVKVADLFSDDEMEIKRSVNDDEILHRLTKREEKLLEMFNALTEEKQKEYLKEIAETRANLERIYKEMKEKEKKSKRAS